jgi:hypothetical protein
MKVIRSALVLASLAKATSEMNSIKGTKDQQEAGGDKGGNNLELNYTTGLWYKDNLIYVYG